MRLKTILTILALAMTSAPVFAYIGPGAGLGAIATLVAITLGLILLIVGFLWFPLRRVLKKRKAQRKNRPQTSSEREIR